MNTILELRRAAGMTQKAFAEYFGIPKRTIEQWEGNQRECKEYIIELMKYKLENENLI
ncbi:MAG: helix-turn-helix domain-containing protein [Clostridia bacterium]|nr:helix-turn-helix domain-containing protein [Clostridia bacterium]